MKKTILFISLFTVGISFAQTTCSDLFISEYVEGWSNNKALEIYNPTPNTINLSNYFVARYSNGSTSATVASAVQLTGSIAPYRVYVAVLDKRVATGTGQEAPVWDSLQSRANGFYSPVYNTNNCFYWNGNDAVMLAKGTLPTSSSALVTTATGFQIVDIFGKIGENPANSQGISSTNDGAWSTVFPYSTGQGVLVTSDHSLLRKKTTLKGVKTPVSFFNALDEWDSIPAVVVRLNANGDTLFGTSGNPILDGNWKSLGSHACNCDPTLSINDVKAPELLIYPNPTSNGILYFKNASTIDKIQVFNSLGQLIVSTENNSKTFFSIDLGDNRGMYLLRITDNSGIQLTKRIIVK
jgi:hypothetical protein